MYLGKIVEYGPWDVVSDDDPTLDAPRNGTVVRGEVPDAAHPPKGCRFHPRCSLAEDVCRTVEPALLRPSGAYRLSCHVMQRELSG